MATGKQWDEHFKTIPPEELKRLRDALDVLQKDKMFFSEFQDSGLFSLKYYIESVLQARPNLP
jgi:hypothetical protein